MADSANPHQHHHVHHVHHHHHSGQPSSGHGHDFSSANIKYFDNMADFYDEKPEAQQLVKSLSETIKTTYPSLFDADQTTLLDYACGPGLMSRELGPYVKSIVGVDISQGMVDRFNLKAAEQGSPPEKMKAIKVELKGEDSELDGAKFDVIICAAAYHHFPNVEETTRILASLLKPGGSILVTDALNDGTGKHLMKDFAHVVPHTAGFSEEEMRKLFEGAGLKEFDFKIAIPSVRLLDIDMTIFLARAVRPVA